MKVNWSKIKEGLPLSKPTLLFIKLPNKSPNIVPILEPIEISKMKISFNRNERITPTSIPKRTPEKKPLYVLPSPNNLFPSMKFLFKSIGKPPPKITGTAFAKNGGNRKITM